MHGIVVDRRQVPQPADDVAHYNQAIQINPKYANAYKDRGNARRKKGDLDGANADFNQAIKLGRGVLIFKM